MKSARRGRGGCSCRGPPKVLAPAAAAAATAFNEAMRAS